MKEDILEQLVDGYFLRKPKTFTKHNVKFKPDKKDISNLEVAQRNKYSVASDIDVLAIHLDQQSKHRVSTISCKSWQDGFDVDAFYENLVDKEKRNTRVGTGPAWKKFRELCEVRWAKAFREAVFRETGTFNFTYHIAVTKFKRRNRIEDFINCELFLNNLSDNGKNEVGIKFITLEDMINEIFNEDPNTTVEATEMARFIQLIKAANLVIKK